MFQVHLVSLLANRNTQQDVDVCFHDAPHVKNSLSSCFLNYTNCGGPTRFHTSSGGGSGPELSQQVKFTLIRLTWSPAASQCRVNSAVFIIFNTQEESDTITPALTSIDKPEHYASSTRLSCSWSTGRQSDRKRNASDAKCFSVTTSTDAPQPAGENDAIVAGNRSWGSFCSKKIIQATNGKKNKGG